MASGLVPTAARGCSWRRCRTLRACMRPACMQSGSAGVCMHAYIRTPRARAQQHGRARKELSLTRTLPKLCVCINASRHACMCTQHDRPCVCARMHACVLARWSAGHSSHTLALLPHTPLHLPPALLTFLHGPHAHGRGSSAALSPQQARRLGARAPAAAAADRPPRACWPPCS